MARALISSLLLLAFVPAWSATTNVPVTTKTEPKTKSKPLPYESQKPQLKLKQTNRSAPVTAFGYLISIFQNVFSPQDGPTCPYRPTCSRFGKEAIRDHGFIKGTFIAADRITRCNPSTEGGHDPVPPR